MHPFQVANEFVAQGPVPDLMGILNCTPDSFFDGGVHWDVDAAYAHAVRLLDEGALIIDVGGESTRPGAASVSSSEEMNRTIPVIERLAELNQSRRFFISIDTIKASVARRAMNAGAHIINDISMCFADPEMLDVVVETGASVVLNHMRGEPRTMQQNPHYDDVIADVMAELNSAAERLMQAGVAKQKICVDPGIGFGKRLEDNYALIARASELHKLGFAVLYGMSRKSYIAKTPGLEQSDRLVPSLISAMLAAQQNVGILRVHDVAATHEALVMMQAIAAVPTGL